MFRKARIAILLYILAFAAIGNYLDAARSTDWNDTLWVDVYPINADGQPSTQTYIDSLSDADFAAIERYFAQEAKRYGIALDTPFRLELAPQVHAPLPTLAADARFLGTALWSLKMRWFAAKVRRQNERPRPDIQLFALFHDGDASPQLDRSTALRRGLIAIARVFSGSANAGSNQVVMAHELLHTLGSSDKYALTSNQPLFPQGYAEPDVEPLLPQRKAELMAGRIPVTTTTAAIPDSLSQTLIGPLTAAEIRWLTLN